MTSSDMELGNRDLVDNIRTAETPTDELHDDPDYEQPPTSAQPEKTRRKHTKNTESVKETKGSSSKSKSQVSLEQFARPAQAQLQHVELTRSGNGASAEIPIEEHLNQDRRKRRKTESPGPAVSMQMSVQSLDWYQQLQAEAKGCALEDTNPRIDGAKTLLQSTTSPAPTLETAEHIDSINPEVSKVTPKKQIKVTKTGKLVSSPPKPKLEESSPLRKRRGRKPTKAKISPIVTVIKYGTDPTSRHSIGGRIEAILNGKKATTKRCATPMKGPPKPALLPKVTHPFFTGKADQRTDEIVVKPAVDQRPPTPRKSAVTPGKLRTEALRNRSPGSLPTFGMSSGVNRVAKQSGLVIAAWPTRETAHVRNLGADSTQVQTPNAAIDLALRPRKAKNRVVALRDDEEVLSRLAKDLATDMRRKGNELILDFAPPEDVRLPTRVLTTGIDIQRRVRERLQARLPLRGEQLHNSDHVHPAVTSLFNDIEHTLTPFDEGRCEAQSWAQKYSPKSASHVLQTGKEATVLRDWLQSLTVMSVGGAQNLVMSDVADAKRPPKKKRKKAVDDFIVSDEDEEDEEMVEFSDMQGKLQQRSFRRPQWTRNKNVVLISGPYGCGKSATVYAVAKELDFEVFEINSGTRRAGKDIQDKVGDMTANHLVNHKRPEAISKEEAALANDIDNERMNTACQKDIDSGRQGTMMNFFKAGPTTKATAKVKPKVQENKKAPTTAAQAMLPQMHASRRSQKQSLILFEEADILFDEDQQFWAQVTKLAAQSKRPIVITCNDERQIPAHDLPLAAILRLQPSSIDLATDYMLVLAGREGHILERRAVSDLYSSKNLDLRASITELNLWCQMSVGDRKGGLEWMYQRWPPGKDVDAQGRLLRVASEGTYHSGMGWLSHNIFETKDNAAFDKEEELLNELWADWGISPTDWQTQLSPSPEPMSTDRSKELELLDTFLETLSAVDVYCRVDLPSYGCDYTQPADPTLPPVPGKAQLSYTLAAPLLQVDPRSDFLQLDTSIYTHTDLLAHRVFPIPFSPASQPLGQRPSTESEYAKMLLKIKEGASKDNVLSRHDYATALDTLAAPPEATLLERTSFNLTPSSFDRTFNIITLELAPYVRNIVAHEQILEAQRIRLSNLLSGGGTGKRARTTRASRVALEGGIRETKRRNRWFDKNLNFELVMATAGKSWTGMGWKGEEADVEDDTGSITGTQDSVTESHDVVMQEISENISEGTRGK